MTGEPSSTIVLFGDSVSAGYGLPHGRKPSELLAQRLDAAGVIANVVAAGVPDEAAEDGLARVDSIAGDIVLVQFGLNDAIRGIQPTRTIAAIEAIVAALRSDGCEVSIVEALVPVTSKRPALVDHTGLLAGMSRRLGTGFCADLLAGLAEQPHLLQADGLHPSSAGAEGVVRRLIPVVDAALRDSR